ncbi:transcriptional regulator, XRE family [Glaciecola punicea ACAM 611]|uniref:Transcriptional regulator, XRE family n=1 Tax=Glaciecola punicea ACAM 611 TaxID=1121923 RepID=H5TF94_9ALTE|nr:mobile mystery protein A [Glaciecola punicea]GAB57021.1 transcriptional regulator, XRE family [Glaciecola punicea ACAM 611]
MPISNTKKSSNTVRSMIKEQYKDIANSASALKKLPTTPTEGWIRSIRKALDMSGAQLASKLNLSRNRISVLERREVDGDITIKQLTEIAHQLGCDLTYALVPKKDINQALEERAEQLAKMRLATNSQNMLLESQSLTPQKKAFLIEELKKEFLQAGGRALWKTNKGETEA